MAGENENSIGTARAYLDIDATDWNNAIAAAKNSAAGLGTAAEAAFDKSTAAQKRAATQLIAYGMTVDKTADQQRALIALMKGVDPSIVAAAAANMEKQRAATAAATAQQLKLNEAIAQQAVIDKARAAQYAENAQQTFNQLLGVTQPNAADQQYRRAGATEAFTTGIDNASAAEADAAAAQRYKDLATAAMAYSNAESAANDARIAGTKLTQEESAAFAAGVEKQNAAMAGSATSAEAQAAAVTAQRVELEKLMNSIDPLTAKLGKLDAQQQQLFAARNAGLVSEADFDAYNAVIEKNRTAVVGASDAMGKFNFNTAQARREYGFMIKDIATGQWGRLEQSTATLANNIGGLGIKFLAIAGTLALVTAAVVGAAKEWDGFVTAIAKGNGLSGTIQQLNDLTHALAAEDGNTLSAARTAVEGLAKAGLLSGDNFRMAAEAATQWASTTGQSADTVISKFNEIAKDPLKAITDGTVKVNSEQLVTIENLLAVGEQQAAVNEVTRLYFEQIEQNSAMVKANLSGFSQLWHEVRDMTKGAIDDSTSYFDNIAKGLANLGSVPKSKDWGVLPFLGQLANDPGAALSALGAKATGDQQRAAASNINWYGGGAGDSAPQVSTQLSTQQIDTQVKLQKAIDDAGTATQKYNSLVLQLNGSLSTLNKTQLEQLQITRADDGSYSGVGYDRLKTTYAKRSGLNKKASVSGDNAAIKADAAAQEAQIAAQTAFVQGQYQLRQLTIEDYYTKLKTLAQQATDVQVAALNKEIAADTAKGASSLKIMTLQSQITTAQQKGAKEQQALDNQEADALKKRQDATNAYTLAQDQQVVALQRSLDAMTAQVGMGTQEYTIATKLNDIYNAQADALAKLDEAQAKDPNAANYEQERAKVLAVTTQKVQALGDAYDVLAQKELNITNGMTAAWKNFSTSSMNLSDNLQSVWTDGLNSIGEAASKTATGVGTSFADMAKSIEATAIKTITNAAVTQFIKLIASMYGGGSMPSIDSASYSPSYSPTFNAKGGTYSSPDLHSHINSIVSQPTMFKFANGGAFGVMGEAGNEAIMPLSRNSSGVLGVRSYAGGASAPIVNVNIQGAPSTPSVTSKPNAKGGFDIDVIFKQMDQAMASGIAGDTSATAVAMKKRYGLK